MSQSLLGAGLGGGFAAGWPGLLGRDGATALIAPGYLHPNFAVARASAGWGFVGGVLTAFGANAPRHVDGGLLVEDARTNSLANSRSEGSTAGVVGSGGGLPAGCSVLAAGGLVTTVIGGGTESGIPYNDVQISGISVGMSYVLSMQGTAAGGGIAAAAAQQWALAMSVRRTAGSNANISGFAMSVRQIGGAAPNFDAAFTPGASFIRPAVVATLATGATGFNPSFSLTFAAAVAIDVTLRIGAPQAELGPFPTSPILAAPGTPAITSRASDSPLATTIPWFNPAQGTIYLEYALISALTAASARRLFSVSDGSINNRIAAFFGASTTSLSPRYASGGATSNTVDVGGFSTTIQKMAYGYTVGANGVAVSMNGAAPVYASPAAAPIGLNRFEIGNFLGAEQLGGVFRSVRYSPTPLTAAGLQALSA